MKHRLLAYALICSAIAGPGEAAWKATVQGDRVNVRARPGLRSEVIGRLRQGQEVTVVEEAFAKQATNTPPEAWWRIQLPPEIAVWVFTDYVDPKTSSVTANQLNVRAGPGFLHQIVGRIPQGTKVEILQRAGDWLRIKAPKGATGYVASFLLKKIEPKPQPPPAAASPPKTAPAKPAASQEIPKPKPHKQHKAVQPAAPSPQPSAKPTAPKPAAPKPAAPRLPAPSKAKPAPPRAQARTPLKPVLIPPELRGKPAAPKAGPALPKPSASRETAPRPSPAAYNLQKARRAIREGLVRRTWSIQAPAPYVLRGLDTGEAIDYLYPAKPSIRIKPFRGKRVLVEGREYIDSRWPKTPVLLVEKITVAP